MLPQQYCLRWRYHHSNLQTMFSQLLERESFCDVTLACEGKVIKAHKIVLSACSTYFEQILSQYEEKDPIVIMKDMKFVDIRCLVEFMYKGEINVEHCHLSTLLKTAEDLRIKGLAEVSWKDEDAPLTSKENSDSNGIQDAALPQVATVMDDGPQDSTPRAAKRRGRPPLEDYDAEYGMPAKMSHMEDNYSNDANDALSSSEHELTIWEGDQISETSTPAHDEPRIKVKKELQQRQESNDSFLQDDHQRQNEVKQETPGGQRKLNASSASANVTTTSNQSFLTPALEKEWSDVVKMNDYLSTRRRQQFWEEPFTKRVMDAIKTKNLEMKVAAELLGVSYGTLYGRYRDSYGCLKHPYRVRDYWGEHTEVIHKLKKKELSIYKAAEQLNMTPQNISNLLLSVRFSEGMNHHLGRSQSVEGPELDEEEGYSILPDLPNQSFQQLAEYAANNSQSSPNDGAALQNCPDITIVKKEKLEDEGKVNNNSDHSEGDDQIK